MDNNFEMLKEMAVLYKVKSITEVVLKDERFPVWSGSAQAYNHHYGKGGLLEHVAEVVELCARTNSYFRDKNKGCSGKLLYLAALFHDAGKMWDYQPVDPEYKDWEGTKHKREIHHISRSGIEWSKAFDLYGKECGLTQEDHDAVLHAILSHHGLREWGSPVAPNSRLAWILHLCDGISARVDDVERRDILTRK